MDSDSQRNQWLIMCMWLRPGSSLNRLCVRGRAFLAVFQRCQKSLTCSIQFKECLTVCKWFDGKTSHVWIVITPCSKFVHVLKENSVVNISPFNEQSVISALSWIITYHFHRSYKIAISCVLAGVLCGCDHPSDLCYSLNKNLHFQVALCIKKNSSVGGIFLHLVGRMQSVAWDSQRPPRVTNWKCLGVVYSPDQVKRKILEVWVRRQARLVQINGLIISYWETIPKR